MLALAAALAAVVVKGPAVRAPPPPPLRGVLPSETLRVRIAEVLDGDTVATEEGERIRLLGIDAPEFADPVPHPLAAEARDRLAALVGGRVVTLAFDQERRDVYGRTLAHIATTAMGATGPEAEAGDVLDARVLVSELMLREGLASIYIKLPNLLFRARLAAAQREAVAARRGIWSLPVEPASHIIAGAFTFHRPECVHAGAIRRPREFPDRFAAAAEGLGMCRVCRP